jgi:hypothetical protein
MMRSLILRIFRTSPMLVALMVAILMGMVRVDAAVSLGPIITNAADKAQHQVIVDYEAEQSERERLRAGLERYNQKQARCAGILAGMTAQLHAQQQLVVFPPVPAAQAEAAKSTRWYFPPLFLILLAAFLLGAGFFLKYRRFQCPKTPAI